MADKIRNKPQRRPIQWVSFDCYGTLVDWLGGFTAILKPIAGKRTSALLRSYHRFEPLVEVGPYRPYREVLTTTLLLAAGEIGMRMTEAQARRLPAQWGRLPIMNDVEDALSALRAGGFKLAVLTNCDEDLFARTQRSFRQPFDLVITAEWLRSYKPSPAHFHCFQRMTGVGVGDWVHVANSLFHDVAPARKLGIQCIWLDREREGTDVSEIPLRVTSAAELANTIRRL
jgi:2-haloacid dehalogenase